jgi:hypothetical protein
MKNREFEVSSEGMFQFWFFAMLQREMMSDPRQAVEIIYFPARAFRL